MSNAPKASIAPESSLRIERSTAAAAAAAYRNLANGVMQPDPFQQQDLATVLTSLERCRWVSAVTTPDISIQPHNENATRLTELHQADSAAVQASDMGVDSEKQNFDEKIHRKFYESLLWKFYDLLTISQFNVTTK